MAADKSGNVTVNPDSSFKPNPYPYFHQVMGREYIIERIKSIHRDLESNTSNMAWARTDVAYQANKAHQEFLLDQRKMLFDQITLIGQEEEKEGVRKRLNASPDVKPPETKGNVMVNPGSTADPRPLPDPYRYFHQVMGRDYVIHRLKTIHVDLDSARHGMAQQGVVHYEAYQAHYNFLLDEYKRLLDQTTLIGQEEEEERVTSNMNDPKPAGVTAATKKIMLIGEDDNLYCVEIKSEKAFKERPQELTNLYKNGLPPAVTEFGELEDMALYTLDPHEPDTMVLE